MSLRLKRLANEARMLRDEFHGHQHVTVRPMGGDPPDRYRVEYRIGGLERRTDGTLVVRRQHEMEIVLPAEYPRQPAACRMLTPVFHPNIDTFTVCTSDFHAAQETLVDLIVRVGHMIAFQKHNIKSPLNAEAAVWCEQNLARLPVDAVDIYPKAVTGSASVFVPPVNVRATSAPPPPPRSDSTPAAGTTDDVDAFTLQQISMTDSSVLLGETRAHVGSVVSVGPIRCMVSFRPDPARIELRNAASNEVLPVSIAPVVDVRIGGHRLRILGAADSSISRLPANAASWMSGHRDVQLFWNGVAASQIALASVAQRRVAAAQRGQADFERTLALARERVALYQWLRTASPTSLNWRSRLGTASDALLAAIRLHEVGR